MSETGGLPTPTASLGQALADWLRDFNARAVAAGKYKADAIIPITLTAYHDGTGSLFFSGGGRVGGPRTQLADTFRAAEAWLVRDPLVEMNLTLGLSADGRFVEAGDLTPESLEAGLKVIRDGFDNWPDVVRLQAEWCPPQSPSSDPRDPRSDAQMEGRDPIFRDHNCWKCDSGRKPCPTGYSRQCVTLHARND